MDGATKLFAALVAGSIIGAEREYKSKNAGFRTVILVTLGSALFTIISGEISGNKDYHIVGNIVVGIGFLGAGTIYKEGSTPKGLTTAVTIWVSAAIGMAIGAGHYYFAFLALLFTMLVLLTFIPLQNLIDNFNTSKMYKITLLGHSEQKLKELERLIQSCNLKGECINHMKRSNDMLLTYIIQGSKLQHENLIKLFYETSLVDAFEG